MKEHAELQSGRFTNDFTQLKAKQLWMEISQKLNAMPGGASKDWKQWRRTWADLKRNSKQRASELKKQMRTTGGGGPIEELTEKENEILSLILPCLTDGHEDVTETNIIFEFENEPSIPNSPKHIHENEIMIVPEEEHSYTMTEPVETSGNCQRTLRGKRTTATRRHITALKLNQSLVNTIEENKDIMSEYYKKKIEFMEFKKKYYEEKITALREANKLQGNILQAFLTHFLHK